MKGLPLLRQKVGKAVTRMTKGKGKIFVGARLDSRIVKALDDEVNKIDEIFYPNRTQIMEKILWKGLFGNKKQKSR